MNREQPPPSPEALEPSGRGREFLRDAIRYWEPRRVIYNLVLVAVCAFWVVRTWPHFRNALTLQSLAALAVLAGLANLCYCAAYLVDLPLQHSSSRIALRRGRWIVWIVGVLIAVVLTSYWIADEIYPSVQ